MPAQERQQGVLELSVAAAHLHLAQAGRSAGLPIAALLGEAKSEHAPIRFAQRVLEAPHEVAELARLGNARGIGSVGLERAGVDGEPPGLRQRPPSIDDEVAHDGREIRAVRPQAVVARARRVRERPRERLLHDGLDLRLVEIGAEADRPTLGSHQHTGARGARDVIDVQIEDARERGAFPAAESIEQLAVALQHRHRSQYAIGPGPWTPSSLGGGRRPCRAPGPAGSGAPRAHDEPRSHDGAGTSHDGEGTSHDGVSHEKLLQALTAPVQDSPALPMLPTPKAKSAKAAAVDEPRSIEVRVGDAKVLKAFTLGSPSRVVVDLQGGQLPRSPLLPGGGIAKVRFGSPAPGTGRVVVELDQEARASSVETWVKSGVLVVTFR